MNPKSLSQFLNRAGLTLVEFLMIMGLLVLLAAVAIPNFIDFRRDAKNQSTQSALGILRSSLVIATASIQLKEDPSHPTPTYPTLAEVQANQFLEVHPILKGTKIVEGLEALPKNPWTDPTVPAVNFNQVFGCSAPKGTLHLEIKNQGWCYSEETGEVWANSALNGETPTENHF